MKAVTWHGTHDVRVDTVDDPAIREPTDAIVRITSTGICGSDLHLYEVLGAFIDPGDVLGHEPMGVVEEVGSEVGHIKPGDRVVIPFNVSCGHCYTCGKGLQSQCETTQVREYGTGAALLGYTKLYGQVPGGQAEFLRVPQAHYGPIKVPEGPSDDRFVYLSDVLPTAWQAVEYADLLNGETLLVLGLGPIGEMCTRIAQHRGAGQVIGVDLVPDRLARAGAHGVVTLNLDEVDDLPEAVRELTDGRGPISVIDAVGMEAHGSPIGKLAHRLASFLPDAVAQPMIQKAAIDRLAALHMAIELRTARRHHLVVGGLWRRDQPDAADPDVRQADQRADGPSQRPALGRRHPAPAQQRRRPPRGRHVRDAPAADRRGAARVRDLPEEAGRRVQDPAAAVATRTARAPRQPRW
jgi:threonine dehydrogenase-like Zn-dependent dehydrogenase